jgi:hypothetical protein
VDKTKGGEEIVFSGEFAACVRVQRSGWRALAVRWRLSTVHLVAGEVDQQRGTHLSQRWHRRLCGGRSSRRRSGKKSGKRCSTATG